MFFVVRIYAGEQRSPSLSFLNGPAFIKLGGSKNNNGGRPTPLIPFHFATVPVVILPHIEATPPQYY